MSYRQLEIEIMNTPVVYRTMPNEEIQQAYNQLAPDYDRMTFVERYLFGVDHLRRHLLAGVSGRVLDVACGSGANFPAFHTASHITAVDLSPGMLDIARHKAERLGLSLDLQVMDAQQLDFEDGSFDVVVSALSTCTFPDPLVALREMGRVVKPDGRILLLEHGRSSWGLMGRYQDRAAQRHFEVAGCRWNQEPLELVQAAGLIVTDHRRSFFGVFHTFAAHS
jgi:ubiquinone/menaquinone biosynthesis C-methylase UbiE